MAEPTTIDSFLDCLRKSKLLEPARLDSYLAQLRQSDPGVANPADLAARMERDGMLTGFQARFLLQGHHRGLILANKYKVLDLLGAGGMGRVYLCEHVTLRRQVAVKVLPLASAELPGVVERFYREARAVASFNDDNILRVFDVDCSGKLHFMVMEYVEGQTFQQIVTHEGPLPPGRACFYVRQAALGLQHAHEAGWLHRDIKPANILVDKTHVVKILDLGLARFFNDQDNLTKQVAEGAVLGTADYIAPEQVLSVHEVDGRADIYSLGATFYFLLAGRPPFHEGTVSQKLIWHQMRQPPSLSTIRTDLPPTLVRVIERMMAKNASDRFESAAAVYEALDPWSAEGPPSTPLVPARDLARSGAGTIPESGGLPKPTVVPQPSLMSRLKASHGGTPPVSQVSLATPPSAHGPTPDRRVTASPPPPDRRPTPAPSTYQPSLAPEVRRPVPGSSDPPGQAKRPPVVNASEITLGPAVPPPAAPLDTPAPLPAPAPLPPLTRRLNWRRPELWLGAGLLAAVLTVVVLVVLMLLPKPADTKVRPGVPAKEPAELLADELLAHPANKNVVVVTSDPLLIPKLQQRGKYKKNLATALAEAQPEDVIRVVADDEGSGRLVLPATLSLDRETVAANVTVEGYLANGKPGPVTWEGAAGHLVTLSDVIGLTLRNFHFLGRLERQVEVRGVCPNLKLEACEFENYSGFGLVLKGASGERDQPITLRGLRFKPSLFLKAEAGLFVQVPEDGLCRKVSVFESRFEGPSTDGIRFEGKMVAVEVIRNRFYNVDNGLQFRGGDPRPTFNLFLENNTFSNVKTALAFAKMPAVPEDVDSRLTLKNNLFQRTDALIRIGGDPEKPVAAAESLFFERAPEGKEQMHAPAGNVCDYDSLKAGILFEVGVRKVGFNPLPVDPGVGFLCYSSDSPLREAGTGKQPVGVKQDYYPRDTASRGPTLRGGGSTFIAPAMERWKALYRKQGVTVSYAGGGSGNGVSGVIDGAFDFGCTDAYLNDDQMKKAKNANGEVIHVPLVMGAIVPVYNLPGLAGDEPIHFTGEILADVYLGKIKKWNDPALVELNKDLQLPDTPIVPVHRSDKSGSTFIWTDYLEKVSPSWRDSKLGVGTQIKWPAGGDEGDGNSGVAKKVVSKTGGLGYVELAYALNSKDTIKYGKVKNRAGKFVLADLASVTAAADAALPEMKEDLRYTLTNQSGAKSYPICGTTWAVLFTTQPGERAATLVAFLKWAVHEGQKELPALHLAPLPEALVGRIDQKLRRVKKAGE